MSPAEYARHGAAVLSMFALLAVYVAGLLVAEVAFCIRQTGHLVAGAVSLRGPPRPEQRSN